MSSFFQPDLSFLSEVWNFHWCQWTDGACRLSYHVFQLWGEEKEEGWRLESCRNQTSKLESCSLLPDDVEHLFVCLSPIRPLWRSVEIICPSFKLDCLFSRVVCSRSKSFISYVLQKISMAWFFLTLLTVSSKKWKLCPSTNCRLVQSYNFIFLNRFLFSSFLVLLNPWARS